MSEFHRMSVVDQTVLHLKEGLRTGRWRGKMPGMILLAKELGVAKATVHEALKRLEAERLIGSEGDGKARRILIQDTDLAESRRPLRVAILTFRKWDERSPGEATFLMELSQDLRAAGFDSFVIEAPRERDADSTRKLARLVGKTVADAWLVERGPKAALDWFVDSGRHVLAVGARAEDDSFATVSMTSEAALRETVRRLVALGHRRIVFITLPVVRHPTPDVIVRAFREELVAAGITPGEYHTPEWEETPEGMNALLESLFRLTPPTALICQPFPATLATLAFCARRGLRIPEDISLMSYRRVETLAWQYPGMRLAHLGTRDIPCTRKMIEWLNSVARGAPENKRIFFPLSLEPGDTLGPVKKPSAG